QSAYVQMVGRLTPPGEANQKELQELQRLLDRKERLQEALDGAKKEGRTADQARIESALQSVDEQFTSAVEVNGRTAHGLAWVALLDVLVFFGVLLVGFAYLWKRGDIDWVRSTAAERLPAGTGPPAALLPAQ